MSLPGAYKRVRTCMRRTRPEAALSLSLSGADAAAAVACASARCSAACPAAVLAGRGLKHEHEKLISKCYTVCACWAAWVTLRKHVKASLL